MLVTAKIATLERNWLVAVPTDYDDPIFFFVDRKGNILKEATTSEWMWATTCWSTEIVRTEWEIGQDNWFRDQTALFLKKEEVVRAHFTTPPKNKEELLAHLKGLNCYYYEEHEEALQFALLVEQQWQEYAYPTDYKNFIEASYATFQKIAALPKCEISHLSGESYSGDKYSGGTNAANINDYSGQLPAIVSTSSSCYWRGGSSRSRKTYYLLLEGSAPTEILTVVHGDGFNIVEDSNVDFDFKEIYKATH